jgi:flagellar biosynthesis protein FlhG
MKKVGFSFGDTVYLKPQSNIYKGTYSCQVLSLNGNLLTVTLPYEKGKVILLGVGTKVMLRAKDNEAIEAEIVDKNHAKTSSLVLLLPKVIFPKVKRIVSPKVISIASGKGGTGKTNLCVNLAIALAQRGLRVIILDADLGTANIDILLNVHTKFNLQHLIDNKKDILDIIVEGPVGINFIPGGSGIQSLSDLDNAKLHRIINSLKKLDEFADVILIDTGAGISKSVINFVLASDEVIVITTPEPHSLADAYALIKILQQKNPHLSTNLVINRVETKQEAGKVAQHIISVANRFLKTKITYLGYILEDQQVSKAIKKYVPLIIYNPNSKSAQCIKQLTSNLLGLETKKPVKSFFDRLKEIFYSTDVCTGNLRD